MKRKLPSLVLAIMIVTLWSRSGDLRAQAIDQQPASSTPPRARPSAGVVPASGAVPIADQSADATADAHALLAKAIDTINQQRSISTQMRHRISMFGHKLVGTGSYQQQDDSAGRKLRLDMKVIVGEAATSMQQVCDERFLWIRRDIGDTQFIGRVDLRRIQEATRKGVSPQATADATNYWMMLGGLPQLLARLDSHFEFQPARQATLEGQPVWVLDGAWKPAMLALLAPSQAEKIKSGQPIDFAELPEQIPTQVRVVLRRSDNFPLHVEYLRHGVAPSADEPAPITPMLAMELFDIRLNEAIDPLVFAYKPGDKEVVDHTELYLKNLGLK